MSTVLIYTSPARGHLYPMMDVAIALRDSGHRVVVQTLADERDTVTSQGLEHRPVNPAVEAIPLDDHAGGNPLAQLRNTLACWLARAPHELDDLTAAEREVQPDLLVVDANSWGAAAYAEGRKRPWAMFLPYCLPVPSADAPAFGPGSPAPRHWFDRARDRLVWAVQHATGRSTVKRLNVLRGEVGAAPVKTVSDLYQRSDVLLYRTAEPFEYPRRDWPANVRAIGPGLWAPPGEEPEWLADLPHPRTLVTVSTEFQDDGRIVRTALAALQDQPGSVIVTTAALDPDDFATSSERVHISRTLPHAVVIPEMDLVITHGGMGTVQRSLAAGVPLCVIPWGRDQKESARRVQQAGAGTMLSRSQLTPERLQQAAATARTLEPGAQRVSEAFRQAGGAAAAVEILEDLVAANGQSPLSPTG
mgnify:FL=1